MANVKPVVQTSAFTMRVDDDFKADVDRLRKLISPTPSKSDAIRIAVAEALAKREKKSSRP